MKKIILALFSLTLVALSGAVSSAPLNMKLVAYNQRTSSALSTLSWKNCPPPVPPATTYAAPCINPDPNPINGNWVINNGVVGSTATWIWDTDTKVLASTGLFWATSYITSNPQAQSVISDRVENLTIDTINQVTTATDYQCIEGSFLQSVNANGCGSYDLGLNAIDESFTFFNVDVGAGPDPYCVNRTQGGDDVFTLIDTPRGVNDTFGLTAGCENTAGAFIQYVIAKDEIATGGQLILSNGSCAGDPLSLACSGISYLTFVAGPTAIDDGPIDADLTGATSIAVMANDIAYTDDVTVTVTTQPTQGTVVVTGSPGPRAGISIAYTPNGGATGTDSFVYAALDADGVTSDSATVSINILGFGANPDSAAATRNTPTSIIVGANDIGFTNPVTITITAPPDQGGTATPPASGPAASAAVAYTPATTAPGTPTYTETFTYQITDGTLTDTTIVTVTVNNTVPNATDGAISISTQGVAPAGRTGTFTAPGAGGSLGNTGGAAAVTVTVQGTKGTATVAGNVITYAVTDAALFAGEPADSFTYTITDADGETDSAVVAVNIPDVQPSIADASISTAAGTAATRALTVTLGNGSSAQNPLTVSTPATSGTCVLTSTSVTYTPNAGFSGSDSCVVTITDGDGDTDTGTLTITVTSTGGGGGGGGTGPQLPPASSSLDFWTLSLLAGVSWLRRKRRVPAREPVQG